MESSLTSKVKLATAGAFLAFGLFTGAPALAQDTATEAADQASEVAGEVEEEAEGFDDWGLLGLLGLAGLAGLRKREPEVRTVERQDRVVNTVGDGTR